METQIIGIVLVRNEEIYLDKVLNNILSFCDHIIIADHESRDETPRIAKAFCQRNPKCHYHKIHHPSQSHDLIKGYAGKKTWMFAVDGDELYDVEGLDVLRNRIVQGEFDQYWLVLGNVLNCVEIDYSAKTASGYMAPPCRSMTKLYNFNAITSWAGDCPERLHGGDVVFKSGHNRESVYYLYKKVSWEDSAFRCMHLCFLQRSSVENMTGKQANIRKNIADKNAESIVGKIMSTVCSFFGVKKASKLKREKYMRGEVKTISLSPFFPE